MKRYTLKELREENNLTQEKVFRKLGRNKKFYIDDKKMEQKIQATK